MKHYLKIVLLTGATFVCYWNSIKSTKQLDSLILQNIEALAENEYPSGYIDCTGNGSADCPINRFKVKYVIEGYNLQ